MAMSVTGTSLLIGHQICLIIVISCFTKTPSQAQLQAAVLRNLTADQILIQPCILYNKDGGDQITFDYSKGGAAVEMAIEYAIENIVPANVVFDTRFVNLGHDCTVKDTSVHYALELWQAGVQCDVFMGPGR